MRAPPMDRRPNVVCVIFQFDQTPSGQWVLGLYECVAGAADSDKARFLRDIILSSKQTRHLQFAQPAWRILRYGTEVPVDYPIGERYRSPQKPDPAVSSPS